LSVSGSHPERLVSSAFTHKYVFTN